VQKSLDYFHSSVANLRKTDGIAVAAARYTTKKEAIQISKIFGKKQLVRSKISSARENNSLVKTKRAAQILSRPFRSEPQP
jgi:hypothetical protein